MNDIEVKYNNDFNMMPIPKFHGRQLDLFLSIIAFTNENNKNSKIKMLDFWNPNKRHIEIPITQFVKICRAENWQRSFAEIVNEIDEFLEMLIDYSVSYETDTAKYHFVCFEEAKWDKIEQTIRVTFQKRFYNMIVNYKLGYTRYELMEFINLTSIYAKRLYMFLKQFRNAGRFVVKWEDFKTRMQIPNTYQQCDINRQVLKQAIKELTAEQNLFDQKRIPFKNLKYQKLNKDFQPLKRRQKAEYIEFTFDIPTIQIESKPQNFDYYKSKKFERNDRIFKIFDIKQLNNEIEILTWEIDKETNLEITNNTISFSFENLEKALQKIKIIKED